MVVISVPSTVTEPEVGLSRPERMCMRVDLPDPDGPMTAVSRPRATSTDTSRRAVTAVSPSPYCRTTPVALITVSDCAAVAAGDSTPGDVTGSRLHNAGVSETSPGVQAQGSTDD